MGRSLEGQDASAASFSSPAIPVLLVTANLGTLFEMAEEIMHDWMNEFISNVVDCAPQFIALHCQEIGGKKATSLTMQIVDSFTRSLLSRQEMRDYDRAQVFIDKEYENVETFTALGSFYLAHRDLSCFDIWDYDENAYIGVRGHNITCFDSSVVTNARKKRFPFDLHPLAKGNRKGFMSVRFNVDGRPMDLVNVHMFYDEDNFVAMESVPSQYTEARKRALRYILDSISSSSVPFFMFGDFNFRLDVHDVVKALTANGIKQEIFVNSLNNTGNDNSPPKARICFVENDELNKIILTVEKKLFDHHDRHDYAFRLENGRWLRTFDNELEAFRSDIYEFEINFPPSYPYVEEKERGKFFMKTRCPAWCDRIVMSHSAHQMLLPDVDPANTKYDMIGSTVCMGDHKPVFLFCHFAGLQKDNGRYENSSAPGSNHVMEEQYSGRESKNKRKCLPCDDCLIL